MEIANHTLTITGTGAMYNYNTSSSRMPWLVLRDSITKIVIPDGCTSIGSSAFFGCNSIKYVTWNAKNCTSYNFGPQVETFVFGDNVEVIPSDVCNGMTKLTSITIPNSVTSIGASAFSGCNNITSVTWNARNCNGYNFGSQAEKFVFGDNVEVIPDNICKDMKKVASIIIPDSVTSIGQEAFLGCSGLTSVTIGNSVTSIGDQVFSGCTGLTSITIPNSVTTIGSSAFDGCSGITSVTWNTKNCKTYNFGSQMEKFVFGDSVEVIPANICENMTQLDTITIPSSVQSVGNNAFKNCIGIRGLNINNGLITIGDYAFYGLSDKNLKTITLPNSVETIGKYAFAECSYLKTITLGAKVEYIDEYAFQNDERLLYVNCYAEEPPVLRENAFDNYNIYLQAPCEALDEYKVAKGWRLFNKAIISCLAAEEKTVTSDKITVTTSANDATFTWPANDAADCYKLEITKDGIVFCTLKFNAQGKLIGIAFAPGRNGNHHAPSAVLTTNGWQFTVIGLDKTSKYAYSMDVQDVGQQIIKSYNGTFATEGYHEGPTTDLNQLDNTNVGTTTKFIRNGQLYILRDGKTYTAQGAKMK